MELGARPTKDGTPHAKANSSWSRATHTVTDMPEASLATAVGGQSDPSVASVQATTQVQCPRAHVCRSGPCRKVKMRRVQRVSRYLYSGDTELDSELAGHCDSGLRTASKALL